MIVDIVFACMYMERNSFGEKSYRHWLEKKIQISSIIFAAIILNFLINYISDFGHDYLLI